MARRGHVHRTRALWLAFAAALPLLALPALHGAHSVPTGSPELTGTTAPNADTRPAPSQAASSCAACATLRQVRHAPAPAPARAAPRAGSRTAPPPERQVRPPLSPVLAGSPARAPPACA